MKRKINNNKFINYKFKNLLLYFFSKKNYFFLIQKKIGYITNYYIKDWLSQLKKDFYVIYAYVPGEYYNYNDEIKISPIACKYIFGVDIFISTYVCEYFSNNSKNLYSS